MRSPYYGLTFTETVTPPLVAVPSDEAVIDSGIADVEMTFEGTNVLQFNLNTGVVDTFVADVPMVLMTGGGVTSFAMNTARIDVMIADVPITFAIGANDLNLQLHTSVLDSYIADVPLELNAASSASLTLHESRVDAFIFDVDLETLAPNSVGVPFHTALMDATIADVTIEFEQPAALSFPLNLAVMDVTIADVPLELNTPDELSFSLNLAIIDTSIADVELEILPPDAVAIPLNVAITDAMIIDVPVEFLPLDAASIPLNVATIDALIADAELAFLPLDAESIPFNTARIDATIADAPMEFAAESAGFDASGLLWAPTSNYAVAETAGTVMFWLQVDADVVEDRRITFAANFQSSPRIQLFVEQTLAGVQIFGIETDDGFGTQTFFFEALDPVFDGQPHFIAFRSNGSSYSIFLDGQPADGFPGGINSGKWFGIQAGAANNFNQLQIGGFRESGGINVELWHGVLDELVHVGAALSNAEILSLYNNGDGATIPEMTAAAWWPTVNAAYELAKDDTRDWGTDYLGVNNLAEDPVGFVVPGDKLVEGGWTP